MPESMGVLKESGRHESGIDLPLSMFWRDFKLTDTRAADTRAALRRAAY